MQFNWVKFCFVVLTFSCTPRSFNQQNKSSVKESQKTFTEWFAELPPGPIANYELVSRIVFHKVGGDILPDFMKVAGSAKMEKRIEFTVTGSNRGSADGGVSMVWMRDYAPFVIKSADPLAGNKARMIPYLSINNARNKYSGSIGLVKSPELLNGNLFNIDNEVISPERETLSVLPMPLIIEGGNLIATGDHVLMTEHVFEQNSPEYANFLNGRSQKFTRESLEKIYRDNGFYEKNPLGDNFEYRNQEQVKSLMARYLEVKPESIISLPPLPGEGTQHIDLFVLALGRKHLLIPQITDEGIATLAFEHEKLLAKTAKSFLDEQASRMASEYGYKVDRLPMVPPIYQVEENGQKQAVYLSPANSLLANLGTGRKKVILPHFEVPSDWGDSFRSYAAKTEHQWQEFFTQNGWEPHFITTNKAARAHGLIRCLTASIPFFSERQMLRIAKLGY